MDGRNANKSSAVFQRKMKLFAPERVSMADVNLMIALTGRIFRRARLPHIRGRRQLGSAKE
eukprot:7428973-Pyramimonas_sp.AAC.1